MLPEPIKRLPGVQSALLTATWVQFRYFDWRHGVHTTGDLLVPEMDAVTQDTALAGFYHPSHPRSGRRILSLLPIEDHSRYTFIDMGSGKGLMLLLAAEHPYKAVRGWSSHASSTRSRLTTSSTIRIRGSAASTCSR